MPAQKTTQGTLYGKLGNRLNAAVAAHKNDETKYSVGSDLPAGIRNGIAQIDKITFGQFEKGDLKGEWFFMASAIVKQPKTHDGIPVEGLRTQIGPEPLCDTPKRSSRKTLEEHVAWVLNEMRKIMGKSDSGSPLADMDDSQLEATGAAIQAAAPHIRFRTWSGEKQTLEQRNGKWWVGDKSYPSEAVAKAANPYVGREPQVRHEWEGYVDYDEAQDAGDDLMDSTAAASMPSMPNKTNARKTATPAPAPEPAPEVADDDIPFDELDAVAAAAAEQDAEAAHRITRMGEKYGVNTIDTQTWQEAVDLLKEAMNNGADEGADEATAAAGDYAELARKADEEGDADAAAQLRDAAKAVGLNDDDFPTWTALAEAMNGNVAAAEPEAPPAPQKGQVCYYKPPKAKKAVECEITAVYDKAQTVNLKNLSDNKILKSVPWSTLQLQS